MFWGHYLTASNLRTSLILCPLLSPWNESKAGNLNYLVIGIGTGGLVPISNMASIPPIQDNLRVNGDLYRWYYLPNIRVCMYVLSLFPITKLKKFFVWNFDSMVSKYSNFLWTFLFYIRIKNISYLALISVSFCFGLGYKL